MNSWSHLAEISRIRELTVEDFGGIGSLGRELSGLEGDPMLVVATRAIESHLIAAAACLPEGFSDAFLSALQGTESPAIYRDTAEQVLASPKLLAVFGTDLAVSSLTQAGQPSHDASPLQALRAADALEVAVQLRLRDYAERWDLFACLTSYRPDASSALDDSYPRAVLRATVACVEQWTGADDLIKVVRRIAGLEPQPSADRTSVVSRPSLSDSDTGLALSRLATIQALRAPDREVALTHIVTAAQVLGPALHQDDRPDIAVAADIAVLLQQLLQNGRIEDFELVNRIRENVRELVHLDPGRQHWVRDRSAASHQAWAQLSLQLAEALQNLRAPSWYHAAKIIDGIVALLRTTGSLYAFTRASDGQALRSIIVPAIEEGFGATAALLRHLQDHVDWLQSLADSGEATPNQIEDLKVAHELRDAALERFTQRGENSPKEEAGAPEQSSRALPAKQDAAIARINQAIERRFAGSNHTLGNLVADELLERARAGFAQSSDYTADVEEATDLISGLLIRFLWDRNQLGESDAPYLYSDAASEEDLASDLHGFLRGSGTLGNITSEIRRIAGGRVDIQFGFPGFNLYVELKVDSTKTPVPDKASYMRQAAAYTVADQRIGFLVVLKLLPARKMLPPHLSESLDVVKVEDAGGGVRFVAALTLSGARTKPSNM